MTIRRFLVLLIFAAVPAAAQSPVKIVGIGATTCGEFTREAVANPPTQRQYLAWMQGCMSGIVIARPPGVDEGIDLNPGSFTLGAQLSFIRDYCLNSPSSSFADAVEALFKKLRTLSSS